MNWSFHYVTDKPKNLLASFKRRDNRAIESIREMDNLIDLYGDIFHVDTAGVMSNRMKEDDLEDTVVIQRGEIVSVYPIIETERQIDNETWVKFDTRPSSLAQKTASLYCAKRRGNLRMEFWSKGEKRALSSPLDRLSIHFATLLCSFFSKDNVEPKHIMEALEIKNDVEMIRCLEELLRFPLFLYPDWRSHWQAKAISPHLYLINENEVK